jgi:hypothetical protein
LKSIKFLVTITFLLASTLVWAQSDRGSITGTVKDPTGAVLPDVQVTATNIDTKVENTATTNDLGLYRILNLPIGRYSVVFSRSGFKSYERKGITVAVGEVVPIDMVLEIGAAAETISVVEAAGVLETQTSGNSTDMQSKVVTDLPLSVQGGRSLENFAYAVTPGVEGNNWTSYIGGSAAFTKEVKIDGSSAVAQIGGHIGESSPSMEAVQEFRVETSGIRAEDMRTGGGVFQFALKSGTNQFHGSAFGFLRNEIFNATPWDYGWKKQYYSATDPANASEYAQLYRRPADRQFDYGFSAGGPIIKNKTFIFGAYEKYLMNAFALGGNSQTVPTPAFLQGDFSALLDTSTQYGLDGAGNPIYKGAIFDPNTGNVFPGNIIPTSRFSKVAQQIIPLYQKYYTPGGPGLINNNALTSQNNPWFHQTQFSVKVDHDFSSANRLNGSYILVRRPRTLVDSGGIWSVGTEDGGPLSRARRQNVNSDAIRLQDSHTFTPNVLNVAMFTLNRYWNGSTALNTSYNNWPQTLGFGDTGAKNLPEIDFGKPVNGVGETAIGYNSSGFYVANTYILNDNLSWVRGRHSMKFGAETRWMQMNSISPAGTLGFSFSNMQTGAPGASYAGNVGFGFASFLLGDVSKASEATAFNLYGRRKTLSLYASDDVKLTPKLTMNLDLRWEFNGRYHEKYGHWANFNTDALNPALGIAGVTQYASSGSDSFETKQHYLNFAPHVGAAYQLTPKAVLRASYGIFYSPINLNYWSGVPYGFAPQIRGTNQVAQSLSYGGAFNWDNGYPGQTIPGSADPNYMAWGMVHVDPQSLLPGYIQQWNIGTQYELTPNLRLSASYLGNRGYHLQSGDLTRNQPNLAAYGALIASGHEWDWVSDQASAAAAGVPYPYQGFSNFAGFALAPYPQVAGTWGPLFSVGSPRGNSTYDALEVNVSKRTSHGLSSEMSYTYSRALGDVASGFQETWGVGSVQDIYNLAAERGTVLPYDQTHVLKGYIAYELPFGNGRRFLSDKGTLMNSLVSGWTLSTLLRYNSGLPLQVLSNQYYGMWTDFGYPIYADVNPNASFSRQFNAGSFNPTNPTASGNTYFDPNAFANPAYGQFGNGKAYYSQLRGFGYAEEDAGLMKYFPMGRDGRYKLSLRFEMYNLFNRHYFADPNTSLGSATFGMVTGTTGSPRQGQFGARFQW